MNKELARIDKKHIVKRYFEFCLGTLIVAIAYNIFLLPNNLVPGGVGGIGIILNTLTGIDPSLVILVASLFLLILSYYLLGKEKTKASVLGSLLFPLFVKLTANIVRVTTTVL